MVHVAVLGDRLHGVVADGSKSTGLNRLEAVVPKDVLGSLRLKTGELCHGTLSQIDGRLSDGLDASRHRDVLLPSQGARSLVPGLPTKLLRADLEPLQHLSRPISNGLHDTFHVAERATVAGISVLNSKAPFLAGNMIKIL
jgi:hypothetical protein